MVHKHKIKKGLIGNDFWQTIIDINSVRVWTISDKRISQANAKGIKKARKLDLATLNRVTVDQFGDVNAIRRAKFEKALKGEPLEGQASDLADREDYQLADTATRLLRGLEKIIREARKQPPKRPNAPGHSRYRPQAP